MTQVKAQLKYLRISPRKVRLVADLVRGLNVRAAQIQLEALAKRGALPVLKLLNSAIANAKHNNGVTDESTLKISTISVNEGRILKRTRARARGRAMLVRKRTSHVNLVLEAPDVGEKVETEKKSVSKKTEEKKVPVAKKSTTKKPTSKKAVAKTTEEK